jgi:putative transposase
MNNNRLTKTTQTQAIEAYLISLIYRNSKTNSITVSALCPWVSHDTINRMLSESEDWSRRLVEKLIKREMGSYGYLILDDTSWAKWAKSAKWVGYVWSGSVSKAIWGMQVVMLLWTDGKVKLPIAIEVYQEDGPSKIKIAKQMLKKAKSWGIVPKYVLFDSWYAAEDLLNFIDKLGWKYITRVKSNRKFNGQSLSSTWPHRYGRSVGRLKQVGHRVVIVKSGRKYFASNCTRLLAKELKFHYRVRQQIEETFRLLKQEFGWGYCQARKLSAQFAHLYFGILALLFSQWMAAENNLSIYQFKRNLFLAPVPNQIPDFHLFRKAA